MNYLLKLWPSGWVCFFIRFGEMYHCITVSAMDALQWMGAVSMRVQTADKNITIIHTAPVHQLTSWEDKSCVFCRKQIHLMFQPHICLELFSLVNGAWSVPISLLIQTRTLFRLNGFFLMDGFYQPFWPLHSDGTHSLFTISHINICLLT